MNIVNTNINPLFIEELKQIIDSYNQVFNKENEHINYINLYQKNMQLNKYNYLIDYLKQIEPLCTDLEKYNILYYGFINSRPNNKPQYFHLDYNGKSFTYFIPFVDLTDKNGTEYLCFYDESNYDKYFDVFVSISKKYLHKEDIITFLDTIGLKNKIDYEFKYANAKAGSLIKMPHSVYHRGRTNETDQIRIMFQITLEMQPIGYIQNLEVIPIAEDDDVEK